MTLPLLQARSLSVRYRVYKGVVLPRLVDEIVGLHEVSFQLYPGEILGVVGESGSGKSTLVKTCLLLQEPTAGDLLFDGMSLLGATESERLNYRHAIQVVFQNPAGSLNPNLTNGRSISEPLYASGALRGRAATDPVTDALVSVGLETAVSERYPGELSGGQQQRVAIARAATTTPRILFADECVSALDVSVQARVLQLLRRLRDELGFALVFVTHDLSVVRALCDSVLVLKEGKAVEQGPADEFFRSPQHPYSKTLLAAAEATHLSREDSQTP